jgi:hypothetical protein
MAQAASTSPANALCRLRTRLHGVPTQRSEEGMRNTAVGWECRHALAAMAIWALQARKGGPVHHGQGAWPPCSPHNQQQCPLAWHTAVLVRQTSQQGCTARRCLHRPILCAVNEEPQQKLNKLAHRSPSRSNHAQLVLLQAHSLWTVPCSGTRQPSQTGHSRRNDTRPCRDLAANHQGGCSCWSTWQLHNTLHTVRNHTHHPRCS